MFGVAFTFISSFRYLGSYSVFRFGPKRLEEILHQDSSYRSDESGVIYHTKMFYIVVLLFFIKLSLLLAVPIRSPAVFEPAVNKAISHTSTCCTQHDSKSPSSRYLYVPGPYAIFYRNLHTRNSIHGQSLPLPKLHMAEKAYSSSAELSKDYVHQSSTHANENIAENILEHNQSIIS
jgi:hypothetical protein